MSQIDQIIYIPLLSWFVIFFTFVFFLVNTSYLQLIIISKNIRTLFLKSMGFFFYDNLINRTLNNKILFLSQNKNKKLNK